MKDNTFDLLLLAGTTLAVGGMMAFANSINKSDQKKTKSTWNAANDLKRAVKNSDFFERNSIEKEMDDLIFFDAELVKLLTEMGFVVTHIFSEDSRGYRPATAFAISSTDMPPYLELGHNGELVICEAYDDLLDTNMIKESVKKLLEDEDHVYEGISFKKNPDEYLRKLYSDCKFHVCIRNAKPSKKSSVGCSSIDISDGSWSVAHAHNHYALTELFIDTEVEQRCSNRTLFNIVSILNKMNIATLLELNLNKKLGEE